MTKPSPAHLDSGERVYRRVLADVNGTATEEEADSLRIDEDSVREWLAILTRMSQDADAELSKIRSDVANRQQRSLSEGPRGKDAYFAYKAQRESDRAGLIRQKAAIVERIKEARDILHVFAQEDNAEKHGRLGRIEKKIDALTEMLKKILDRGAP